MKNLNKEKINEGKIPCLDYGEKLEVKKPPMTSQELSINLIMQLMQLMKDVNEKDITPETVKAGCMCAEQIYKILKLNFEIKKEGY